MTDIRTPTTDSSASTTRILRVFDPPMCCATGACGPEPDPALAIFAGDLKWVESNGVQVERLSLAREPELFASTPAVAAALGRRSVAALPLVLLGEEVLSEGEYPSRKLLAARLGIQVEASRGHRLKVVADPRCTPNTGCCGGSERP